MGNRRHHTIPRFYLNRFIRPGWVYRRNASYPRPIRRTKDISVRVDYYGRPEDERKALDEINKVIEREGAPALDKLINESKALTASDWSSLSYLFANLFVRNPITIDTMKYSFLSDVQQVNEMAKRMVETYEKAKKEGKDLSAFAKPHWDDSPSYSIDEYNKWADEMKTKNGYLNVAAEMFCNLNDIAECIEKMTYLILVAPVGLFFLTCDRPLILLNLKSGSPIGAGWKNADALATIPLSPKSLLMMCYHKPREIFIKEISAPEVYLQNIDTMTFAVNEVYSPREYKEAENWMFGTGRWTKS